MTDVIHISWDSGYMNVAVDQFFPTDLSRTRKVFKLMLQDPAWTYDKIDELLAYFEDRQKETVIRAAELQLDAARQKAVADDLKAKKPKRKTPEYAEYMEERDKAYRLGVTARATAREAEGLKKTLALFREMNGRTA